MVKISKNEKNIKYTYRLHSNLKQDSGLGIQTDTATSFVIMILQHVTPANRSCWDHSNPTFQFPSQWKAGLHVQFCVKALQLECGEQPPRWVIVSCRQSFPEGKSHCQRWGGQLFLCSCEAHLCIPAVKAYLSASAEEENPRLCPGSPSVVHYHCIDTINNTVKICNKMGQLELYEDLHASR